MKISDNIEIINPHSNKPLRIPVEELDTDYGKMLILGAETNQRHALQNTKKAYDHEEVTALDNIVKKITNPVFFDIGSNFGVFTLGLAKTVSENGGYIHTFEPQRIVYNCLVGSIALNGYDNIYTYNVAIGKSELEYIELPNFDYTQPCSFGSIEFGENQIESLQQKRKTENKKEYVKIISLDSFIGKIDKLDLIKIDVEGMEESVLESAEQIIKKYKPIIFVEYLKSSPEKLYDRIVGWGYTKIFKMGVNFLCTE